MGSEGAYGQVLLWRMLGALTRENPQLRDSLTGCPLSPLTEGSAQETRWLALKPEPELKRLV